MFRKEPSFRRAIKMANSICKESIELLPKPNVFGLSLAGKADPQVIEILEAFLISIEAINMDSILKTKFQPQDIQNTFHLLLFSENLSKRYFWDVEAHVLPYANSGESWPFSLTDLQALTLILYFVVVRILIRMVNQRFDGFKNS
jgi:hypothetical protein